MVREPWSALIQQIRTLAARHPEVQTRDAELLHHFLTRRDEAAFETLLHRHGPMVYRTAWRILGSVNDAEDVFQATFLLLVRRGDDVRKRDSVAGWLHGVAHRLALTARAKRIQRQAKERQAAVLDAKAPAADWTELEATLHEVLAQLPEKYRTPLVFCYLEGWTQEEVARHLGRPLGTVRSWVARGREMLRKRLIRRGVSLSAGTLLLTAACAPACVVSVALRTATREAALLLLAGGTAATPVAPSVAELMRRGATAMLAAKIKRMVCLFMLIFVAVGAGAIMPRAFLAGSQESSAEPPQPTVVGEAPKPPGSVPQKRLDIHGDPLPPGAVARLGTVRFRHEDAIGPFAISPDGRTIVAAPLMFGKSVVFWDVSTGQLVRRWLFDREIHYLAFHPDGKSIALGSVEAREETLRLYDIASGKETHRFAGNNGSRGLITSNMGVWGAAFFTPDGQTLVTSNSDETVRVWNVPSGKMELHLNNGHCRVWALSPNGKLMVQDKGDSEKILRVMEVTTGKAVRQLSHPTEVRAVVFSPDGKTLAVAHGGPTAAPGKITLWSLEDGKELGTLGGHLSTVPALAFSPNGKRLVSGGRSGRLLLWDVGSRKELRKAFLQPALSYQALSIQQLAFSPDGKTIFLRGKENQIHLWDVEGWRERDETNGQGLAIWAVAFSRDGKRVASAPANDGICVWESKTGKLLRMLKSGSWPMRFSADGKTVLSGQRTPACWLHVWDSASGKKQQSIMLAGSLERTVAVSSDGKMFASWILGPTVDVFGVGPNERRRILKVPIKEPSADAPPRRGQPRRIPRQPWIFALCFAHDSKPLYACSNDAHILRWDLATGAALPSIGNQDGGANGIALAPDGRCAATVPRDGAWFLWEIASGQPRLILNDAGHAAPIAFSPNGRLLAAASKNGAAVHLLRMTDGKVIHRFSGHLGRIGCLSFSPDGRLLASGSYDSTALLWDVSDRNVAQTKAARPFSANSSASCGQSCAARPRRPIAP